MINVLSYYKKLQNVKFFLYIINMKNFIEN